jgi:hypothetical protein
VKEDEELTTIDIRLVKAAEALIEKVSPWIRRGWRRESKSLGSYELNSHDVVDQSSRSLPENDVTSAGRPLAIVGWDVTYPALRGRSHVEACALTYSPTPQTGSTSGT